MIGLRFPYNKGVRMGHTPTSSQGIMAFLPPESRLDATQGLEAQG